MDRVLGVAENWLNDSWCRRKAVEAPLDRISDGVMIDIAFQLNH